MSTQPPDPYAVLGIEPGASAAEITAAYRRAVRACHPDAPHPDRDRFAIVLAEYRQLRGPPRGPRPSPSPPTLTPQPVPPEPNHREPELVPPIWAGCALLVWIDRPHGPGIKTRLVPRSHSTTITVQGPQWTPGTCAPDRGRRKWSPKRAGWRPWSARQRRTAGTFRARWVGNRPPRRAGRSRPPGTSDTAPAR
ncbi:J domain-containing protein [Amycolatopsis acidicola]|uniref:J domain-containing protein n=1 Tax=Amycolatopsis acidicola TaxID=2596893 RepID=A0A5N0V164_9PSEU|nr:J domain-containing protein [Amycolatopsis acidicola]